MHINIPLLTLSQKMYKYFKNVKVKSQTFPQARQWCRRKVTVNSAVQDWHIVTRRSWIHTGAWKQINVTFILLATKVSAKDWFPLCFSSHSPPQYIYLIILFIFIFYFYCLVIHLPFSYPSSFSPPSAQYPPLQNCPFKGHFLLHCFFSF